MTTMEIKGPTLKKEAELVKVLRGDNSSDQLSAQLNVAELTKKTSLYIFFIYNLNISYG